MSSVVIAKKITGFKVIDQVAEAAAAAAVAAAPTPSLPDSNPLEARLESRPVGELESITRKVEYSTAEGKRKLSFVVSFMAFEGVVNGEKIVVERPIEFFLPAKTGNDDQQWITATMRSLSLAARAGFVARALQDLRSTTWTKGQVRCGTVDHGKGPRPVFHESEVAAIAWEIQQSLMRRGFLDSDGNEVPATVNAKRYAQRMNGYLEPVNVEEQLESANVEASGVSYSTVETSDKPTGLQCKDCKAFAVTVQGGCEICGECGASKCG